MRDDLVKRVDSLMVLLDMERKKSLLLGKHIDKLEAALREVANINNRRDRFSAEIDWVVFKALEKDDAP